MRRMVLLSLLCSLPVGSAIAQAETAKPAAPERSKLVLPPGEIAVAQLVQIVARATRHNILFDEQVAGRTKPVSLTEPVPLDPASCEETLCSLLFTRQLGLLPVDSDKGIYEVVSMIGPRGRELEASAVARTPEQILAAPDSKRWVLTTVQLQHQNSAVISNALRPMLAAGPGGLTMGSTAGQDGLTLRGIQSTVAAALQLVRENDKPRGGLPPTQAETLAARITALEGQIKELQQQLAALRQAAGK